MISEILFMSFAVMFSSTSAQEKPAEPANAKCLRPDEEVLKRATPKWPLHTRTNTGMTTTEVTVDGNGKVVKLTIVDAQPKRAFDRASKKALAKWRFTTSAKPSRCFLITLIFELAD